MKITILLTLIACLSMQQLSSASEGSLGNVRALKAKATKSPKGTKSPKSTKHVINFDEIDVRFANSYIGNEENGFRFNNAFVFNATFMDIWAPENAWDEVAVSKPNGAATINPQNPVRLECPGGIFKLKSMTIGTLFENNTDDLSAAVYGIGPNGDIVASTIIEFEDVSDVKLVKFPKSFKSLRAVSVDKKTEDGGETAYGFDDIEVEVDKNYPCDPFSASELLEGEQPVDFESESWWQ